MGDTDALFERLETDSGRTTRDEYRFDSSADHRGYGPTTRDECRVEAAPIIAAAGRRP
jgi:hypothetical protein